ncbi:MAG: sigma-70 factor domain-containing protein [Caldilineaceae bacterium]
MPRPYRTRTETAEESIQPIPRSNASVSELDEYINLGAQPEEEEDDVLDELIEEVEEEDEDALPLPKIERDEELEEEIEKERLVPVERLLDDVAPEHSQSLDPVRMYLRDIGQHALLTAEDEMDLAQRILDGKAAEEKMEAATEDGELDEDTRDLLDFWIFSAANRRTSD